MYKHGYTDYIEQSPSWEANSHSARQETSRFYRTRRLVTVLPRVRVQTPK